MAHKSFNELQRLLQAAQSQVAVGSQYFHYKTPAKTYTVLGLCVLEANDAVAVRYAHQDALDVEFIRALGSWLETVECDGQTVPRFTRVDTSGSAL